MNRVNVLPGKLSPFVRFRCTCGRCEDLTISKPSLRDNGAHLDTTTGTQPSGCRVVSIAPCCSVNAAFLFAEPRLVVVVSRRTRRRQLACIIPREGIFYLRFPTSLN